MSDKEEDEIVEQNERRRSTTVIMTNSNFIEQQKASSPPESVRRTGSMRRRLSKQNATHEEPENSKNEQKPVIEEEEAETLGIRPSLQRVDAIVGDDDTKLRPPGLGQKHHAWSTSKSLSRESTGTDYSDRSGTDLRQFIRRTLHKSEEDRDQLIYFERIMRELVENPVEQSAKIDLPSSYHRMLFHRCAAWFGLDHNVTNKHTEIVINKSEKTKMPEDRFTDLIINNDFMEGRFTRHSSQNSRRDPIQDYGSQASLSHDLQNIKRAQSFEQQNVAPPILPPSHAPNLAQQMRQLSLQPQWAAQRSFDCSGYSSTPAMMRKAESYGNLEPPSVLVHHYHHCLEEPAHPQPVYHQFAGNFYPGYTVHPAPPPPQTTVYYHPIPYGTHFIQPEFVLPPSNDTPSGTIPEPFPHVEHFQMVVENQTETRRNFQKPSLDAGYGSMNQEISETSSSSAKESDKS